MKQKKQPETGEKEARKKNRAQGLYRRQTLQWRLTLFVFGIMILSGFLTAVIYSILFVLFRFSPFGSLLTASPILSVSVLFCTSAIIGTFLAGLFGKYYLRPLKRLIHATREVRNGNFTVQVESEGRTLTEMDILINNFNEMVRELGSIELLRNDFINSFSHEFKTPIVSIRGFAKELQFSDLPPEQRQEYAKIIAEESDRLAKLSTSVLELTKLENQQMVTDKTKFYLDEQLRQCILLSEQEWSRKNIEMIPELDEVQISASEEILAHAWKNLISNAIRYTPEGGTVRITLKVENDSVIVSVSDNGIGMSKEVRAHIFDKFYQGDPAHHKSGYGIGLTMVKRAVELSGGNISVESEVGKGSTFTVTLPLSEK